LYTGGNNCSGYTVWTTSDGQTGGNTSANQMCIQVQAFKTAGFTATARYTGGCISATNIATVNTNVDNLNTFATAATTLYTNQRSTLAAASGSKGAAEALLTKFHTQITDYTQLSTDYATYVAYIDAFQTKGAG